MNVIERTAMRVVVEHRGSFLAPPTAALAAIAALAATVMFFVTAQPLYLVATAAAGAVLAVALWLCHGVRTTLDAAENVALWERTGVLRARRQAKLCDVRGVVLLPNSDDEDAAFNPVLTVAGKRWPLSLAAVRDAAAAQAAIDDVLDLAKGRRAL